MKNSFVLLYLRLGLIQNVPQHVKMKIIKTKQQDLDPVFAIYEAAIAYQKMVGKINWKGFERELVKQEITDGIHYLIMEGDKIACTFIIKEEDRDIWGERDDDPAVYIHRIATNPDFRGGAYVQRILDWAKAYCLKNQKSFIRLDTASGNERLHNYYLKVGFSYVGEASLDWSTGVPEHYKDIELSLFEIKL